MKAEEFWNTLPHCCGYPNCDGDLEATQHSEKCPLYEKAEISMFDFAERYACQFAAAQLREAADATFTEPTGEQTLADWLRARAAELEGGKNEG